MQRGDKRCRGAVVGAGVCSMAGPDGFMPPNRFIMWAASISPYLVYPVFWMMSLMANWLPNKVAESLPKAEGFPQADVDAFKDPEVAASMVACLQHAFSQGEARDSCDAPVLGYW